MSTRPEDLFVLRFDELHDLNTALDRLRSLRSAGIIRQLLIDRGRLVDVVRRSFPMKLRFRAARCERALGSNTTLLMVNNRTAGFEEAPELTLDQFLALPLLRRGSAEVSVSEVIDYAANAEGGVHFDPRAEVRELYADDPTAPIDPLAHAIQNVATTVLVALEPLRTAVRGLFTGFPIWGYYKLPRNSSLSFEKDQFGQSSFTLDLAYGFSINAMVRLSVQAGRGERVLFQLGNEDRKPPTVTVLTDGARNVRCVATVAPRRLLRVEGEIPRRSNFQEDFSYIGVQLCFLPNGSRLTLWVNGTLVDHDERSSAPASRSVTRMAVGADIWGKRSSSFDVRELILADWCVTDEERAALMHYLWLDWHK